MKWKDHLDKEYNSGYNDGYKKKFLVELIGAMMTKAITETSKAVYKKYKQKKG